jgi:hypothetical protein
VERGQAVPGHPIREPAEDDGRGQGQGGPRRVARQPAEDDEQPEGGQVRRQEGRGQAEAKPVARPALIAEIQCDRGAAQPRSAVERTGDEPRDERPDALGSERARRVQQEQRPGHRDHDPDRGLQGARVEPGECGRPEWRAHDAADHQRRERPRRELAPLVGRDQHAEQAVQEEDRDHGGMRAEQREQRGGREQRDAEARRALDEGTEAHRREGDEEPSHGPVDGRRHVSDPLLYGRRRGMAPTTRTGWHRIIVPEPRPTSDVPYHHDRAPGQKFLVLADSVVPGSPIYVAARRVDWVPPEAPRWLDPHEHDCNSFYVFIGDGPGLTGLEAMATIGERTFPVASPSAVLIPPYTLHHYWMTAGAGWYFQITLRPEYVASLVPPDRLGQRPAPPIEAIHQPARRQAASWHFIGPEVFAGPGISLDVVEVAGAAASLRPLPPAAFCLDVVLGRGSQPLAMQYASGDGPVRVAAPGALVHVGERPVMTAVEGAGLLARMVPEAPFATRDR